MNISCKDMYSYETISQATEGLFKRGYTANFVIEGNVIRNEKEQFEADEFEIYEYYRFEGDTDPADEAIVYAVATKNGTKGIIVNGYGIYADAQSSKIIQKLQFHH